MKIRAQDTVVSPEPAWASIIEDRLPDEAFVSAGRKYAHHWVRHGEIRGEGDRYTDGEMYLHKGGLIEAIRRAEKDGADPEVLDHLRAHQKVIGFGKKSLARKEPGDGIMKEGRLPRINDIDLYRIVAEIDASRSLEGEEVESKLPAINRLARTPLKAEDVFAVPLWVSNDLPDAYFTRMDPGTTLINYVEDFNESRSLMVSHSPSSFVATPTNQMPIGATFESALKERDDAPGKWVEAWMYMLRGITVGDLKTDDAIRMIEGGIWSKVSIGFTLRALGERKGGYYECEICGNRLMSEDCSHLPGREYEGKVCIARIIGASAREVSLVYMNAAQGTVVQKARMLAERGMLEDKEILALEMSYGVRFMDRGPERVVLPVPAVGSGSPKPKRGASEDPTKKSRTPNKEKEEMETLRALLLGLIGMFRAVESDTDYDGLGRKVETAEDEASLRAIGKSLMGNVQSILNRAQSDKEIVDSLPKESRTTEAIVDLLKCAEDGRAYRAGIIEEAIEEGVRFAGEDFDADHWRSILSGQPLDIVRKQRDQWKRQADAKVEPGQRTAPPADPSIPVTRKDGEKGGEQKSAGLPDHYYQHGKAF